MAMAADAHTEDKFGGLAEEARRRGDIQIWNLYMTAGFLAVRADGVQIGVVISPDGELFHPGPNSSKSRPTERTMARAY
jgi:hypothetical protein